MNTLTTQILHKQDSHSYTLFSTIVDRASAFSFSVIYMAHNSLIKVLFSFMAMLPKEIYVMDT